MVDEIVEVDIHSIRNLLPEAEKTLAAYQKTLVCPSMHSRGKSLNTFVSTYSRVRFVMMVKREHLDMEKTGKPRAALI